MTAEKEALVSVCMTAHNDERYIEQAIASVLCQKTDFAFELIIGEDSPTDGTGAIIDRLAQENPERIVVKRRPTNLGMMANLERTVADCRGKYIAFLDADDFWTSDVKLQKQVDCLESHPEAALCFHKVRSLNEVSPHDEFITPAGDCGSIYPADFLIDNHNPICLNSVVARRRFIGAFPDWYKSTMISDWPILFMLAQQGTMLYLPGEMSRYRVHDRANWSRLPARTQAIYVIQTLLKLRSIASSSQSEMLVVKARGLAEWCAGEVLQKRPLWDDIFGLLERTADTDLDVCLIRAFAQWASDAQSQAGIARSQAEISQSQAEIARTQAEIARTQVESIIGSSFWRATYPLRRAVEVLPISIRRLVRRAIERRN